MPETRMVDWIAPSDIKWKYRISKVMTMQALYRKATFDKNNKLFICDHPVLLPEGAARQSHLLIKYHYFAKIIKDP